MTPTAATDALLENFVAPAGARVLVAMSGGVDSSLAAWLLAHEGHAVVGVNMRTHRLTPEEIALGAQIKTCCSPVDAKDARACAEQSGFPFYSLDLQEVFEKEVIDPFVEAYKTGRTPNSCVLCNNKVKLGLLMEKAAFWDCQYVATGHYARKVRHPESGRWTLARAKDRNKDQTYYLFGLQQWQLERLVLPLGTMEKSEVRERARAAGLATAEKPESQELCFIPSNDYRGFLRRRFAEQGIEMPSGKIVTTRGEVLGDHKGIAYYTVGQRRGLEIAHAHPLYVVRIDVEANVVVVGAREEVLSDGLVAAQMNWMAIEALDVPRRAWVQIRHRHAAAPALAEPGEAGRVRITFDSPQQAVSPGQAVVLYDEEERVLGGGWIERPLASEEAARFATEEGPLRPCDK